jgi:long-chain fatty acid transport protein
MKLKKIAALVAIAAGSAPAFATNGMNMEGYGPIATGMGGAAMAYDHGTAGMINNPATLGLIQSGTSRLDVAIGGLHPKVTTKMNGMPDAGSGGKEYYMPAVGYVRKDGPLAWGVGMMAQGGMGTEYGSDSFMSGNPAVPSMAGAMYQTTAAERQSNRSELGLARVMFPVSYDLSNNFKIAGSIDYLWGGLDLQMVMSGQDFGRFAGFSPLGPSPSGVVTGISGPNSPPSMIGAFAGFTTIPGFDLNWAQFDFNQGTNKMKQALKTDGWAGNIGFQWQATPQLSVGGAYHAKTHLSNMEGSGTIRMGTPLGVIGVTGRLSIIDFQWPETYGIGLAYKVNDQLLIAADYKRIGWAKVMKNFTMNFVADNVQANPYAGNLGNTGMTATLYQNWKDQDVFMIGAAYKVSAPLTVRIGANLANNPIPDNLMNPLFPATIKNHYTFGLGYELSKASSMDFALTYAPKVSVTNASNPAMPITTTHAQTHNWQLMYSQRF